MKSFVFPAVFFFFFIQSTFAQEIPLTITDQGYILTEVALNDTIKANFFLDTAAGITVLSAKTFDKIDESVEESGFFTGFRHDGDRIDSELYRLPSLTLGGVTQNNPPIGVYPPLDDYGIDGLISLSFFEDRPFTINFTDQTLSFVSSTDLTQLAENHTVLPIYLQQKAGISLDIFIPICLNNSLEVLAEFDTGSGYGGFLINPHFIDKLELNETQAKTSPYKTPISGTELTDTIYTLDSVGICSNDEAPELSNVTTVFRENLIYEALIGSLLFKDRSITIDIPDRRFIIH